MGALVRYAWFKKASTRLRSRVVVDVAVTEIVDIPFEVWDCPPPCVGSADHVPNAIDNVLAPTVLLGEERLGPVSV